MALADTSREFALPVDALQQLVEGCEWDIAGRRYATFDELVEYCRRVAGTVGRLSLAVYGSSDPAAAAPLADALGIALQLTNILRDLLEDRDLMGRVYIPSEDLDRFGVSPELEGAPDDLMALICFETGRASTWYEQGLDCSPCSTTAAAPAPPQWQVFTGACSTRSASTREGVAGKGPLFGWAEGNRGSDGPSEERRMSDGAGRRPSIAVVGGGLAGISAALACADAGAAVTL